MKPRASAATGYLLKPTSLFLAAAMSLAAAGCGEAEPVVEPDSTPKPPKPSSGPNSSAEAVNPVITEEPVNTEPSVKVTPLNVTVDLNQSSKGTVSVDRAFTVKVGGRPRPTSFIMDVYDGEGEKLKAPWKLFLRLEKNGTGPLPLIDAKIPVPADGDGRVEVVATVMRDMDVDRDYIIQFTVDSINGEDTESLEIIVPQIASAPESGKKD